MIIGFDASRAFVKDKTGTENYSYQLLKHLAQIDTENSYIVYVRPGAVIAKQETSHRRLIPGSSAPIVIPESPTSRGSSKQIDSGSKTPGMTNARDWPKNFKFVTIPFPRLWTQFGLALRTFLDPIGILFVPAHTYPVFHKPGLKIVMTIHDLGSEYLPGMHQLKQKLYLDFITRYQLKSATSLIAVSNSTKQDLIKRANISEKKIRIIYEGVNNKTFKPVKNDILNRVLNKYDLQKQNYFLFVGTIQPRKNLKRLIEAFSIIIAKSKNTLPIVISEGSAPTVIPESNASRGSISTKMDSGSNTSGMTKKLKLILAGSKGWLSDEIYRLPEKLGIKDRVKFLGRVKDQELAALYTGAIALIYPSLYEGFGLPLLEAMSCGCPVITSNISSMPEIAGNAAILINPEKTEEIAKQARSLIKDDKLRNSLIQKGIIQAKKFTWRKCAENTLQLFKEL